MDLWTNAAVILTGLAAVTFCLVYGVSAPWTRYAVGRNIMALMAAIVLFVGLGVIRMVTPTAFDDMTWIRPAAWSLVCAILWWRVYLLVRTQVLKRRDDSDPEQH
jgi:hypothetical protein